MSIFGKVLVILNVLAAGAFIYLGASDWGQRQIWSYAVYRQDLALDGLPLDEQEKDPEGVKGVDRLSDKTIQEMFRTVGDGPPADKTQLGEVRRVHQKLRSELDDSSLSADQKRVKLLYWLVPLQRTGGKRDTVRRDIVSKPIDELTGDSGPFEEAFKEVLESRGKDPRERRKEIAHLLFNLTPYMYFPDPQKTPDVQQGEQAEHQNRYDKAYQRVLLVVGLKEFANEADRQYYALRDMIDRVTLAMAEDRASFEKDYQEKLKYLYLAAEDLDLKEKKLAEYEKLTQKHKKLVADRQADLMDLTTQLDTARQLTQKALVVLTTEQQRLFEAERHVATSAEKNQQLEREIRTLEKVQP